MIDPSRLTRTRVPVHPTQALHDLILYFYFAQYNCRTRKNCAQFFGEGYTENLTKRTAPVEILPGSGGPELESISSFKSDTIRLKSDFERCQVQAQNVAELPFPVHQYHPAQSVISKQAGRTENGSIERSGIA